MLKLKETSENNAPQVEVASSASGGALFKEDMPNRKSSVNIQDLFKNGNYSPDPKRKGLEYGEDNTLMGRLGARMAARDHIDKMNLGTKPVAKTVDTADFDFRPGNGVRTLFKPKDKERVGGPPKMDDMPPNGGMGLHQQTYDIDAMNMSDPIKAGDYRDTSAIEGSNMADQARNQGNVFGTRLKIMDKQDDLMPGGLSDNMPDSLFDEMKLQQGIKVELEHTTNQMIAREIAKDHLAEDPDYYEKLKQIHA